MSQNTNLNDSVRSLGFQACLYAAPPHTFWFSHSILFYAVENTYTYLLLLLLRSLLEVVVLKPGKSTGIVSSTGAILSKNVGDTSKF